jgi:hypothetical protein
MRRLDFVPQPIIQLQYRCDDWFRFRVIWIKVLTILLNPSYDYCLNSVRIARRLNVGVRRDIPSLKESLILVFKHDSGHFSGQLPVGVCFI